MRCHVAKLPLKSSSGKKSISLDLRTQCRLAYTLFIAAPDRKTALTTGNYLRLPGAIERLGRIWSRHGTNAHFLHLRLFLIARPVSFLKYISYHKTTNLLLWQYLIHNVTGWFTVQRTRECEKDMNKDSRVRPYVFEPRESLRDKTNALKSACRYVCVTVIIFFCPRTSYNPTLFFEPQDIRLNVRTNTSEETMKKYFINGYTAEASFSIFEGSSCWSATSFLNFNTFFKLNPASATQ